MPSLNTFKYLHGYGKSGAVEVTTAPVLIDSSAATNDAYVVKYDTLGNPKWAARITTSSANETANSVSVHTDGSVYVVGIYSTINALIYNADGTTFASLINTGDNDAFIVKYNSNGVGQWAARIAGTSVDVARGVCVDSSGNMYVMGDYSGTVTIFNSDGTSFGTLANSGSSDAFLVKYNSSGTAQWSTRIGSTGADIGNGVAVDSSGNVYVTGQGGSGVAITAFNSNGTSFSPTITNIGANDAYVVKYDTNGFVQWHTRIASTGTDIGLVVTTDSSGNLYVGGRGGGPSVTTNVYNINNGSVAIGLTSIASNDAFLAKYDTNGTFLWAVKIGGSGVDVLYGLITDSSGNIYACGTSTSAISVNVYTTAQVLVTGTGFPITGDGGGTGWIIKYDSTGVVQYVNRVDSVVQDIVYGLGVDSGDNLYVAGRAGSSGNTSFNTYNSNITGNNIFSTITLVGNTDAFVVKYNSNGAVQWARRIGSTADDQAYGIAVDSAGNSYTCGQFSGTRFSMYGPMSVFNTLPNAGGQDSIAVKYNTNGVPQWAARIASTANDDSTSTAVDPSGNIYFGGRYNNQTLTLNNGDGSTFTTLAAGGIASYIAKYNSSGTGIWAVRFTGNDGQTPTGIATDSTGNVYICGDYRSTTTTFFNSDGTTGLTLNSTAFQNGDAFMVKYNSNGFAQWVVRFFGSSTSNEVALAVATDSSGNIYVSGSTGSGVSMTILNSDGSTFGTLANGGATDAFLIKYDSNGFAQWVTRVASTGLDYGNRMCVDSSNNVIFAGYVGSTSPVVYNSDGSTFITLPFVGLSDTFVVKYNSNGFAQWAVRAASSSNIQHDYCYGCAVDSNDNIYIVGSGATTIFYNSDGTAFSRFGSGGWLVKYNSSGFVQWVCRQTTTSQGQMFSVGVDSSNYIYVSMISGGAGGSVQMFNSDGSTFGTATGAFTAVAKYDSNGFGLWAQNITILSTPTQHSRTTHISVTPTGDVYFTGQSLAGSPIQIFNNDNTIYKYLNVLGGGQDAFLVKYSSGLIPQWAAIISGTGVDTTRSTVVDVYGDVYVYGTFNGTLTPYNASGTPFSQTITSIGGQDLFIVKYNTTGVVQWISQIGSTTTDNAYKIYPDPSYSVYTPSALYVSGQSTGTINLYNSDGTLAITRSNLYFSAKIGSSGFWNYCVGAGLTAYVDNECHAVVDGELNMYMAISSNSGSDITVYASDGNYNITAAAGAYIIKFDVFGDYIWAWRYLSATGPPRGITCDVNNNFTIIGIYSVAQTVRNFDGTTNTTFAAPSGGNDVYVISFNTGETINWTTRITSTGAELAGNIITDGASIVVTGRYTGTITILNANGTTFKTLAAIQGTTGDVFVVKYNTSGAVQWASRLGTVAVNTLDIGYDVCLDPTGAVCVTGVAGTSGGGFIVFDTSNVATSFIAPPNENGFGTQTFFVKYTSAGDVQAISQLSGNGNDEGRGIASDSSGNIFVSGMFNASALVPATS